MVFRVFVVGRRVKLRGGKVAAKIRDFFRAFVDEQHDDFALGIIFEHAGGDVLQQRRLSRARRRDDQPALPFPDGTEKVNDARRHAFVLRFEPQLFVRRDARELLKLRAAVTFVRVHAVDPVHVGKLRLDGADVALHLAFDPASRLHLEALDQVFSDERIRRIRLPAARRRAQRAVAVFVDDEHAGDGNFLDGQIRIDDFRLRRGRISREPARLFLLRLRRRALASELFPVRILRRAFAVPAKRFFAFLPEFAEFGPKLLRLRIVFAHFLKVVKFFDVFPFSRGNAVFPPKRIQENFPAAESRRFRKTSFRARAEKGTTGTAFSLPRSRRRAHSLRKPSRLQADFFSARAKSRVPAAPNQAAETLSSSRRRKSSSESQDESRARTAFPPGTPQVNGCSRASSQRTFSDPASPRVRASSSA